MLKMKTLTIGDKTYQVWDPEAARIDDAAVGENVWSSQKLVEFLCPSRSSTGRELTCVPAAESALQLKSAVVFAQSGTPSPAVPVPITGIRELTAQQENDTEHREYTVQLGQEVCCGSFDWASGTLTLTHKLYTVTGEEAWGVGGSGVYATTVNGEGILQDSTQGSTNIYGFCSHVHNTGKPLSWGCLHKANATRGIEFGKFADGFWGEELKQITVDKWKAYVKAQAAAGTPIQILYELDAPVTVLLTPQPLTALPGENRISSPEAEITVTYRADPRVLLETLCIE